MRTPATVFGKRYVADVSWTAPVEGPGLWLHLGDSGILVSGTADVVVGMWHETGEEPEPDR